MAPAPSPTPIPWTPSASPPPPPAPPATLPLWRRVGLHHRLPGLGAGAAGGEVVLAGGGEVHSTGPDRGRGELVRVCGEQPGGRVDPEGLYTDTGTGWYWGGVAAAGGWVDAVLLAAVPATSATPPGSTTAATPPRFSRDWRPLTGARGGWPGHSPTLRGCQVRREGGGRLGVLSTARRSRRLRSGSPGRATRSSCTAEARPRDASRRRGPEALPLPRCRGAAPGDGKTAYANVGRMRNGQPVRREAGALSDLRSTGSPVFFFPF